MSGARETSYADKNCLSSDLNLSNIPVALKGKNLFH